MAYTQEVVKVEDIEVTRQQDRPPPPPKPPVVIEAPPDEILDDIPIASSEVRVADVVAPPAPKQQAGEDTEEYFMAVEEMPQLIGGMTALMKLVEYPDLAVRAGIQGRVYVLAYVNEQGDVVRAEVLKGIGAGCGEEDKVRSGKTTRQTGEDAHLHSGRVSAHDVVRRCPTFILGSVATKSRHLSLCNSA